MRKNSTVRAKEAKKAVQNNKADAISFGRIFIANPDLPKRIQTNAILNPYSRATFYGGDEKGYTDYPALN
ncbi:MAG: hypothetical protein ACKN84_03720 [Candidatus Fonsibacter sp.]